MKAPAVDAPRARIVAAAARLLEEGGEDAVSTRAVSASAGVQAPTIYRLFGDKQGLLDAVVTHGFESYLAEKTVREETDDPVADLRLGWDLHVGLALERPALYTLMYARPRGDGHSPAARAAFAVLAAPSGGSRWRDGCGSARSGRSGWCTPRAAASRCHSIAVPRVRARPRLSDAAREAVVAAITTDAPDGAGIRARWRRRCLCGRRSTTSTGSPTPSARCCGSGWTASVRPARER